MLTMAPNVTIHQYGCFLISLANLFQAEPLALLKVPFAFDAEGNLDPQVLAKACGGQYMGSRGDQNAPGWQIGVTDKYKSLGYSTHFFCLDIVNKKMIDPLKFPAIIEPLAYNIIQIRQFNGTRLNEQDTSYPIIPQSTPPATEIDNLVKREERTPDPVQRFSLSQLIIRLQALFHHS